MPDFADLLEHLADRCPPPANTLTAGELDGAIRAAVLGEPWDGPCTRPETSMWWDRLKGSVSPDNEARWQGDGPLLQQHEAEAIEVWTDAELSALHAAWFVAKSPAQQERIERAVAWHLEHLQPDNATNRPWAIHVFYLHGTLEAEHHAATLIHNVQASGGTTLAGLLLRDAAAAIRGQSETTPA